MSGSSDTPRGWEAGGAGTNTPKRRKPASKICKGRRNNRRAESEGQSRKRGQCIERWPGHRRLPTLRLRTIRCSSAGDKPAAGLAHGGRPPDQLGFRDTDRRLSQATAATPDLARRGRPPDHDCARPGAGKGRGALIPNLLTYEGPVIVIDPKGEACHDHGAPAPGDGPEGARDRSVQGDHLAGETDSLNPMDAFTIPGVDASALAMDIAKLLSGGGKIAKDPFWDIRGHDLSAGVIAAIAATAEPEHRNLIRVRSLLKKDDSTYNLAVLLDTCGGKLSAFAHEEISSYLQTTEVTRSGIHATACSYFSVIASEAAQRTVAKSTIDLDAVRRGDPMTIYLVVPPDQAGEPCAPVPSCGRRR
jgi:hypothetical protein